MGTILVVEDYPVTQRLLSYTLEKNGHTVVLASNGQEALEQLAMQAVDMAIVDITMPIMDGLALLRHLRADPHYRDLPIVMLTASGQDDDYVAARREGANDFLTKPSGSHELLATVNRHLRSRT